MRGHSVATIAVAAVFCAGSFLAGSLGAMSKATAADLPAAPVYKAAAAPAAPAADWTGFYAGLGVGARWADTETSTLSVVNGAVGNVLPFACSMPGPGVSCTGQSLGSAAFRFAPYVGYDWQFASQWVAGFEGDGGIANNKATLNGIAYPGSVFFSQGAAGDSLSVKSSWDAGLRARLGFLVNPTVLLYATGGAAWQHFSATATCRDLVVCGPPAMLVSPFSITDATTRLGYSVGGGFETMLTPHWLIRAEYRYSDFGNIQNSDTVCATAGSCLITATGLTTTYKVRLTTQIASFGLGYKF